MDPRFAELLTELDEALTAIADDLIVALVTVPPNMELAAVARERIEAARDAIREMRDQERGDT
jgi:hypothetical protein